MVSSVPAAARRARHVASLRRPASCSITSRGRMPEYVVRQLSWCTWAMAAASAAVAARSRGSAGSGNRLDRLHEMLGIDAEEPVDVGGGRGFAEAVDADHGALQAHVLAPEVRDARFDRHARQALRQHALAPRRL